MYLEQLPAWLMRVLHLQGKVTWATSRHSIVFMKIDTADT